MNIGLETHVLLRRTLFNERLFSKTPSKKNRSSLRKLYPVYQSTLCIACWKKECLQFVTIHSIHFDYSGLTFKLRPNSI